MPPRRFSNDHIKQMKRAIKKELPLNCDTALLRTVMQETNLPLGTLLNMGKEIATYYLGKLNGDEAASPVDAPQGAAPGVSAQGDDAATGAQGLRQGAAPIEEVQSGNPAVAVAPVEVAAQQDAEPPLGGGVQPAVENGAGEAAEAAHDSTNRDAPGGVDAVEAAEAADGAANGDATGGVDAVEAAEAVDGAANGDATGGEDAVEAAEAVDGAANGDATGGMDAVEADEDAPGGVDAVDKGPGGAKARVDATGGMDAVEADSVAKEDADALEGAEAVDGAANRDATGGVDVVEAAEAADGGANEDAPGGADAVDEGPGGAADVGDVPGGDAGPECSADSGTSFPDRGGETEGERGDEVDAPLGRTEGVKAEGRSRLDRVGEMASSEMDFEAEVENFLLGDEEMEAERREKEDTDTSMGGGAEAEVELGEEVHAPVGRTEAVKVEGRRTERAEALLGEMAAAMVDAEGGGEGPSGVEGGVGVANVDVDEGGGEGGGVADRTVVGVSGEGIGVPNLDRTLAVVEISADLDLETPPTHASGSISYIPSPSVSRQRVQDTEEDQSEPGRGMAGVPTDVGESGTCHEEGGANCTMVIAAEDRRKAMDLNVAVAGFETSPHLALASPSICAAGSNSSASLPSSQVAPRCKGWEAETRKRKWGVELDLASIPRAIMAQGADINTDLSLSIPQTESVTAPVDLNLELTL